MPLSVLNGTERTVKKTATRKEGADADIELTIRTATHINSPQTPKGLYRLAKRIYYQARYARNAWKHQEEETHRRRIRLSKESSSAHGEPARQAGVEEDTVPARS